MSRAADVEVKSSGKVLSKGKLLCQTRIPRFALPLLRILLIKASMILIMPQSLPHHLDRLAISLYFSIGMSPLQLFNCILLQSARAQRLLAIPSDVTLPLEVSRRGISDGCCRTDHIGQDLDTRVCEPIVAQLCNQY